MLINNNEYVDLKEKQKRLENYNNSKKHTDCYVNIPCVNKLISHRLVNNWKADERWHLNSIKNYTAIVVCNSLRVATVTWRKFSKYSFEQNTYIDEQQDA